MGPLNRYIAFISTLIRGAFLFKQTAFVHLLPPKVQNMIRTFQKFDQRCAKMKHTKINNCLFFQNFHYKFWRTKVLPFQAKIK